MSESKLLSVKLLTAIVAMLFIPAAMSQAPPHVSVPAQQPQLLEADDTKSVEGVVLAYDWATRYYMEGARVERFIFKTAVSNRSGGDKPTFVRVVFLWHPADKPRILPSDFYAPNKEWRLTVRASTPFDFVRRYCETESTQTFMADVGDGRKVELFRYVSPAVLPPNAGIHENFKVALTNPPASPSMPDPSSIPCIYLQNVTPVRR